MVLVRSQTISNARRRSRLRSLSRQEHMQEILEERQAAEKMTLDKWFEAYDADGSKGLDRLELTNLIKAMQPGLSVTEEGIDKVMKSIHAASEFSRQHEANATRFKERRASEADPFASFLNSVSAASNAAAAALTPRRRSRSNSSIASHQSDHDRPAAAEAPMPALDLGILSNTPKNPRAASYSFSKTTDHRQHHRERRTTDVANQRETPRERLEVTATKATKEAEKETAAPREVAALVPAIEHGDLGRRPQRVPSLPLGVPPSRQESQRPLPITKEQLRMAIQQNLLFGKETQYLDSIFNRYDVDKSGFLEPSEVKALMVAAAHGDVLHFEENHACAQEAAYVSFKLKGFDDMKKKGVINDKVWREKRANIAKNHEAIMSPQLSDRSPDENDVAFVLAQCDKNNDGKISKDELFMAIGLWIQISHDAELLRRNSLVCNIM